MRSIPASCHAVRRPALTAALTGALTALLIAGCTTAPPPPPVAPAPQAARPVPAAPTVAPGANAAARAGSDARNAKDYRRDAASHLYASNSARIYKGRLPPMLYAVGVLDVDIDRQGQVRSLRWQRAPRHAPEVMKEIERTVHAAAPYPVAHRLGNVTYTDVWLWHKSGRFQLDTLTEGQD